MVKLEEFISIPKESGIIATRVKEDDVLTHVRFYNKKEMGEALVVYTTDMARTLMIPISELSAVKRPTFGYTGIALTQDDKKLISLNIVAEDFAGSLVIINKSGKGKKTNLSQFPLKKRSGTGVMSMRVTADDPAVQVVLASEGANVIIASKQKLMMINEADITEHTGRITKGVTLINIPASDSVQYMGTEN